MVALSESVMKTRVNRPLASKSRCCLIRLAVKARYFGNHASQIKSYYWSLSGSNGRSFRIHHKNRLKHPLAEKSWWCNIRLAIKLRYIGNHASQIKSYYGTLWGSHGPSFRIHHEKLPEAPPGGEITMTWYLTCNILNHASQIKSYYGSLSGSPGRLVIFIKKQQILTQKTYQFINVVNGVSHSHKTANIFFSFDSVA